MLQKFLFIGVGGSGGKTLRILRQELERRLEQVGYDGRFPRAWQMIHIDVPDVPDGNELGLPPQLPAGAYTGLAPKGLTYANVDQLVTQQGVQVLDQLAGWRPDPAAVGVAPAFGAGQYRAVGRMVTLGALANVKQAVRRALDVLNTVDVDAELDAVTAALGVQLAADQPDPQAVVVSSIAGGAGSGAFLDVCDVLRLVEPGALWTGRSMGILYTPDVFSALPAAARGGVHANGLAAVAETLSGYWHAAGDDARQYDILAAAGLAPSPLDRSGPRYPFLVGRSNDEIGFGDQNEAYRAVARSLAALVTSVQVQDAVKSYLMGNWDSASSTLEDTLGLSTKSEKPFTSLGYGSVSLGRDRFSRYASRRLARHAIERLLRGHWNERVPEEQTPEAARDQVAHDHLYAFEEQAGLRELGPEHNQILDVLRGGDAHEARRAALKAEKEAVMAQVAPPGTSAKASVISTRILARLEERRPRFLAAIEAEDAERALTWVREIQDRVIAAVALYAARIGLPATTRLLDLVIEQFDRSLIAELRREAETTRNTFAGQVAQRVAGALQAFEGEVMLADNPQIEKAAKEAVDTLWAEAEASVHERAAQIVDDFVRGFLRPLRSAVDRAREKLETQTTDTASQPSRTADWSTGIVPASYTPAQNEVLLEGIEEYPGIFTAKLRATTGAGSEGEALSVAIRDVVLGADAPERQQALRYSTNWVPSAQVLRTNDTPRSAAFEATLDVDDLLRRAQEWTRRPNTAFSMHVDASLAEYLDPANASPTEHQERMQRFRSAFRQALDVSRPLVSVRAATLNRVHQLAAPTYHRVMTTIPFPAGHPAREVVRDLLLTDGGIQQQTIEDLFGDGRDARIEISTFLGTPYEPVVFSSLMQPIADEWAQRKAKGDGTGFWKWRRTRPLPQFVPASPDVRLDMIRGWFVGRILGVVDVDRPRESAVTVVRADGSTVAFPFPLAGPPVEILTDLLPAVLESLPIALVEMAGQNDQALAPYTRLRDLGRTVNGGDPDYAGLPESLADWVLDARPPVGITPPPDSAGKAEQTWSERLAAVEGFLERYRQHYEQELGEVHVDLASLPRLGRAWELRDDLLLALRQLRQMAERTRTRSASGMGGIG